MQTNLGAVVGKHEGAALAFLGIPFAEAPVDSLRWRPPVPVEPWEMPREAKRFPPPCLQIDRKTHEVIGAEDCLYLNVWRPAAPGTSGPLPVIVFIHGGGNIQGSTSVERSGVRLYDGAKLAVRGDVVVVTLQYRLGPFGYLTLPSLDEESKTGTSGNWALMDQMLALRWVHDNIAAFSGDPHRVLLFGESGGATDVCALLASPLAAGLFDAAIIQSGGCTAKPQSRMVAWSKEIAEGAHCADAADPLQCLRGRPGEQLLRAANLLTTDKGDIVGRGGPTIDGYVLADHPVKVFARGDYSGVPVIIGVNAQETASPRFGIPWRLTADQYRNIIEQRFPATYLQILKLYPAADYSLPHNALVAVTTDRQFVCPARLYAHALARGQSEPVYRYLYTHKMSGASRFDLTLLGAAHGFELLYIFQHVEDFTHYTPTPEDARVEKLILELWISMARTGRPSSEYAPAWPTYDLRTDPYLVIAASPAVKEGLRIEKCNFWRTTYGRRRHPH
ncbi:MAG: carboxylesterase family protein [Gammaproteobacteria bacterium]|nr:carboxylesterase family protein [Gammaproteobacteria bacterium]